MPSWKNAGWRKAERKTGIVARTALTLRRLFGRFSADTSGQIAVIFGLSGVVLVVAIGSGVDLTSAYAARQKLSHIATLTCQYSNRSTVQGAAFNGPSGQTTYAATVNAYATNSIAQQAPTLTTNPTPGQPSYFNYNSGNSSVGVQATMPTSFMQIIGVPSLPLSVTVQCGISNGQPPTNGQYIVHEGFENSNCGGNCYYTYNQNGQGGNSTTPNNSVNGQAGYIGTNGTRWEISGYCVEVDSVGQIKNSVPEGTHSAELDCDNGLHSAGNSAISTSFYLAVGSYELRYNYTSRIAYPNYDPAYVCGSTASDLSWASDTYAPNSPDPNPLRTNQINVYLDKDTNGAPPYHTTIDGTQQLAGSNLIDMCVESANWIERSVVINVTTAGTYWLSFAADGQNDSYGGQVDNIRFCNGTCPGTVQDNFPFTANQVLFEDKFDSPASSEACMGCGNVNSTLNSSYGTAGGWPNQASRGWVTAPYNQITYVSVREHVDSIESLMIR